MSSGKTESAVFFGSGPVSAKSLELLLRHSLVEAVITKPQPPHHKGAVPVLKVAQEHGLRVLTASDRSELDRLINDNEFTSRYAVLIDFGIIVSQHVIDTFELGIINSHFSLLPLLRGADPITWSIANGDSKTGVSLMLVAAGLDTGKLITSRTLLIDNGETAPSLTEKLIKLSDTLLQTYVPPYLSGELTPYSQPHPERATHSRKLTKADGIIDWSQPAQSIERKIRAFIGWPQSRARLNDQDIIITTAHVIDESGAPGEYRIDKNQLVIFAGDQALSIDSLKPAGKGEMTASAFLAGYANRL